MRNKAANTGMKNIMHQYSERLARPLKLKKFLKTNIRVFRIADLGNSLIA